MLGHFQGFYKQNRAKVITLPLTPEGPCNLKGKGDDLRSKVSRGVNPLWNSYLLITKGIFVPSMSKETRKVSNPESNCIATGTHYKVQLGLPTPRKSKTEQDAEEVNNSKQDLIINVGTSNIYLLPHYHCPILGGWYNHSNHSHMKSHSTTNRTSCSARSSVVPLHR